MVEQLSQARADAKAYRQAQRLKAKSEAQRTVGKQTAAFGVDTPWWREWRIWLLIAVGAGGAVFLFWGFWWAGPGVWPKGFDRDDGGFLQNLLSEGLGIVVTVAAITPLTEYFVERERRRAQAKEAEALREARKVFFKNLFAKTGLMIQPYTDNVRAIREYSGYLPTNPQDREKNIREIAVTADMIEEQILVMERTLERASPLIPLQYFDDFLEIAAQLERARRGFDALGKYALKITGRLGEPKAKLAGLDLERLIGRLRSLAEKVGVGELGEEYFGSGKPHMKDLTQSVEAGQAHLNETIELIRSAIYSEEIAQEDGVTEFFERGGDDDKAR